MESNANLKHLPEFINKMKAEDRSGPVIENFSYYYKQVVDEEKGLIYNSDIMPVGSEEVKLLEELGDYTDKGKKIFNKAVQIVLNGGLGTSMGLLGPKSLLKAKHGESFLKIIMQYAKQNNIKLALMNSFNTDVKTSEAAHQIDPLNMPIMFLQHKFPKILKNGFGPADWPANPELEWNPPGHGDIYAALHVSGILQKLLDDGILYAFICNADNLGANIDPCLLGYFAENNFPFMMELAQKTKADVKGGHLARSKKNNRLLLREIAQCPKEEIESFKDIEKYGFFNTNNIWINLKTLNDLMTKSFNLGLQMILNEKNLDPRDSKSPKVYQIETAMGAAISLFDNSAVVKVPRTRFLPVKKCNDLLAIRSDCFEFSEDQQLIPKRKLAPIKVDLDPKYYTKIDDFDNRFKSIPSLIECESLTVRGDVYFDKDVIIKGNVCITNNTGSQKVIKNRIISDKNQVTF